jgi:hypothetical protein
MRLRNIFLLYLKARIMSWLTSSELTAFAYTRSMSQIGLATFRNGRMADASPRVPDGPTGVPGTMDGPPENPQPPTE